MTAFYLKYRPQSLNELNGQESVKKNILGSLKENKLSHAYLLAGPRGTGKTSTARILAKMVNCESQSDNLPCNKCSTCLSITDGSNLDLIEIDAASNRGIEDIRTLREKIKLSPSSAKKKVYIVDECHMLTTEAFNALLKTLEEPPSHVLFILATTDAGKLPQTILSRVQRLDFKLAASDELMETLNTIALKEKIKIDEEALKLLVKKAEGSFRDGIKLLDQVSALGGKITLELLEKSLKSTNFEVQLDLIKFFSQKDTTSALSLILKQIEEGVDSKGLILSLMDNLRNMVFIKNGLGERHEDLAELAQNFSNQELVKILDTLQNALEKMKYASIPSLPLELAVVEICGEKEKLDVRSEKVDKEDGSLILDNQISSIQPQNLSSNIQPFDSAQGKHLTSNDDILKLKEKWTYVCETIRPYNFSLEALLRSTNIKECTDSTVMIEVPYSFHQRILEAPKNRDLLEGILSDVLGRVIHIATVLGARMPKTEDIANIEVAQDDEVIRVAAEIFNSDSIN